MKPKILFLCTGNSCRSQMAEGWTKHLFPNQFEAFSAGTEPQELNQNAVKVMKESYIDISNGKPKLLQSLDSISFDLVVTVCDDAAQTCPTPPKNTRILHRSFDDPPRLAKTAKTEDEAMQHYRRIRDEIKEFVLTLPNLLEK